MRIHRAVAVVELTVPLVLRNPVVVLLGLVPRVPRHLALHQLSPRQRGHRLVVPVIRHHLLVAQGDQSHHAHLHLVRTLHALHRLDVRKELAERSLQLLLSISSAQDLRNLHI